MEGYLVPLGYPTQDSLVLAPRPRGCIMKKFCSQRSRLLCLPPHVQKPWGFRQDFDRSRLGLTAVGRAYDLLSHVHGSHPGWVQRIVLRLLQSLLAASLRHKSAKCRSSILH